MVFVISIGLHAFRPMQCVVHCTSHFWVRKVSCLVLVTWTSSIWLSCSASDVYRWMRLSVMPLTYKFVS